MEVGVRASQTIYHVNLKVGISEASLLYYLFLDIPLSNTVSTCLGSLIARFILSTCISILDGLYFVFWKFTITLLYQTLRCRQKFA